MDLSAHISYSFTVSIGTPEEKIATALDELGTPIFQGAFSTILGISVLAAVDAYAVVTFFKTVFLVMVFGLMHGLVYLPVMLVYGQKLRLKFSESCKPDKISPHDHVYHEKNFTHTNLPKELYSITNSVNLNLSNQIIHEPTVCNIYRNLTDNLVSNNQRPYIDHYKLNTNDNDNVHSKARNASQQYHRYQKRSNCTTPELAMSKKVSRNQSFPNDTNSDTSSDSGVVVAHHIPSADNLSDIGLTKITRKSEWPNRQSFVNSSTLLSPDYSKYKHKSDLIVNSLYGSGLVLASHIPSDGNLSDIALTESNSTSIGISMPSPEKAVYEIPKKSSKTCSENFLAAPLEQINRRSHSVDYMHQPMCRSFAQDSVPDEYVKAKKSSMMNTQEQVLRIHIGHENLKPND